MKVHRHASEWPRHVPLLLAILVFLFLPLLLVARAGAGNAASAVPAGMNPCLSDDPYSLENLRRILNNPAPSGGVQQINPYLTVEFIDAGILLEDDPDAPLLELTDPPGSGADEPPADEADYREVQLRVFNPVTRNEFHLIAKQTMLDDILQCHQQAGWTSATEGVDDPSPEHSTLLLPFVARNSQVISNTVTVNPQSPAGWSNGNDTRIIRSPTTLWPWRTISQFSYSNPDDSRCTGTLIGPRHLVTAAHCINKQGTNQWYTIRVTPGKNGVDNEPYGNSVISLSPAPGTEVWYFTPWRWRDPNLTHWQWDWGLIVIPDRLGDLTGWMGYAALSGNYLKTVSNYNRGYPLCGTDNQPINGVGCQDSRLYGDTKTCGIGNFYNPGPDGWNRRISVSCDMSGGHSGSAVYNYFWDASLGKYVPVVAMVASTESCKTCGPNNNYPNVMRRITPGDLSTISWLRETFP
jgi:V8-like Glu-specific endopeptidase